MESNNPQSNDIPSNGGAEKPSYSEDGVDLTLIRWMLSLTPAERLEVLRQHNRMIAELRDANSNL
ncbi:MAG TPA: hypothetical protein VN688_31735 [Gemmataceae bacterium]|nr:hypothetical protein [Gemmataceae bacterium]